MAHHSTFKDKLEEKRIGTTVATEEIIFPEVYTSLRGTK